VALTGLPNPATTGQTVTLTATVTPSTATGLVQFFEVPNYGLLGTRSVSGGSASLVLSPDVYTFPVGTHTIIVNYNGDANYAFSTSPAVVLTVVKANSTTTLAGPASPLNVGQAATFTATVTPSSATGTVQFLDGGLAIGTVAVNGGTAVFSTTALAAGSHSITAAYSGNGTLNPSTSAPVVVQVVKYATTTSLTNTPSPSIFTEQVSLVASVSPPEASGTVQ